MKHSLLLLTAVISFIFSSAFASDADDNDKHQGEQLFKQHCAICHAEPLEGQRRLAPPMFAVKNHYLAVHDEELSFVDAINSWVANPEEAKSLMKGAIRHFNLMPKIVVAENEVTKIAEYIFSDKVAIPDAYKKHYESRHSGKTPKQYSRLLLRQFRLTPAQVDELDLSDEQLSEINQLIVDKEVLMQPMREEVLRYNHELQTLDSRKENFINEIELLADVNAKRVEQMVKTSGSARAKIEAVLNDKQYQQFLKFRNTQLKR